MGTGTDTKLKVLLIQLPHPGNVSRNVPLAAGYLKAWAHHCRLLDEVDIEIPDPDCDRSGCQRLIDRITEKSPDILGVSLYLWNSARTLFVVEQVRKRLPSLRVVVGGPEVLPRNTHITGNDSIDYFVIGEGEETFVDLLRHFLRRSPKPATIPGLAFRQDGVLEVNSPRPPIERLELLPSPYLLGYIDPTQYREMMIFTMRGCLQGCSYCAWSARGGLRPLDLRQLREELLLARSMERECIVSIADSAFNTSPVFTEFCRMTGEINQDRRLRLNCFVQVEQIDRETAQLLKKANVVGVEVGLQSVSAEVLRNVARPVNLDSFRVGMENLRKENIPVVVDTILGLPGDDLRGFEETMGFLAGHTFQGSVFNLSITEGSRLRERINKFRIEVQEEAPFYVRSSATFPRGDMEEAMRRYLGSSADFNPVNDLLYPTIVSDPDAAGAGEHSTVAGLLQNMPERPITNLVVCLGNTAALQTLASLREVIARHAGSHLSVLCRGEGGVKTEEIHCLQRLVLEVSRTNPFITWDIFFEGFGYDLQQDALDRLHSCLFTPKGFLDYRYELFPADVAKICRTSSNVLVIFPWQPGCATPLVQEKQCIMKVVFGNGTPSDEDIDGLLGSYGSAVLVDFCADVSFERVNQVMQRLFDRNSSGKSVYFKDWVLQRIWEQDYLKATPDMQSRFELLVDPAGELYAKTGVDTDLYWDAISRWNLLKPGHGGQDFSTYIIRKVLEKLPVEVQTCG